jgi:hypothetical protein
MIVLYPLILLLANFNQAAVSLHRMQVQTLKLPILNVEQKQE